MVYYDIQQVCLNGHQITDRYNSSPVFRKNFCNKCGSGTIHQCLKCKHPIKGNYEVEDVIVIGHTTPVPSHCENCGSPYPWTKAEKSSTNNFVVTSDEGNLHPWPVILSVLLELPSDEVCSIIGLTGLHVDWTLTKAEAYSHTTRKRAYLPKIQKAYDNVPNENKLIVAWNAVSEILKRDDDSIEKLNPQLEKIGWKIENNHLTPVAVQVKEIFFPTGTTHDAYIEIKRILQRTKQRLDIIDPYIDNTIFQILATISAQSLQANILSFKLPVDIALETKKFISQHQHIAIEIRTTKEFHDRFIIIDRTSCYHFGASLKDAGNKAFMISEIEDSDNISALLDQQGSSWAKATIIQI